MTTNTVETPEKDVAEQEQGAIAVSSDGAATQNTLRKIGLIIGREYKNRVTQRSFIITSVVLLVIVFLAPFIPTAMLLGSSHSSGQARIVVVNNAGSVAGLTDTGLADSIGTALNGTTGTQSTSNPPFALTFSTVNALASLQHQVKSGQLDILLVLDRTANQDLRFTYYTTNSSTSDPNLPTIQALTQQLTFLDAAHRLGLTEQETRSLATPPDLVVMQNQQSQNTLPVSAIVTGFVLAYAGAIMIYVSIGLYGSIVASGVAEEKSSRMMEILVNVATPFQLLAGKIVGIGAACMTQMGGMVAVGIVALLLQAPLFGARAGGFSQYLTGVSIPFYLQFLLYVLLAFFMYATLVAGLATMVKRQEEVQSAIMLPQLLMVSGYLLFFFAVYTPDAPLTKLLSYIPFWTPWLMLPRIARGTVAWWEIVVTSTLMLLTILACIWFAARLYRYGVLMYGQKPGLGQVMKLAFDQ